MLYKHILLTTDLSEESLKVSDKAIALAELLKASLSIIHVVNLPPIMYGFGEAAISMDSEGEDARIEKARRDLDREAERLGIMQSQRHVMIGGTTDEVIHLIKKIGVDLVLVGAHDKHGLGLLYSSTADEILHALPCDVVAIKV